MDTSTVGLAEKITDWWLRSSLFDPAGEFGNTAIFIESYAVRGGLAWVGRLEAKGHLSTKAEEPVVHGAATRDDGLAADAMVRRDVGEVGVGERLLAGAYAFCDRVVYHQGIQGPAEALMMGYGLKVKDGQVCHACVADQASVAMAVLETIALRPKHPRVAEWLSAIERWADWVLANFAKDNGAIGVGIFCHKWNPIDEYWCATGLMASALFKLAEITGNAEYAQRGLSSLDWLGRFDYTKVEIPTFTDCAPEVVLYTSEGIVAGVRYLVETEGIEAARCHSAAKQFGSMARWLVEHQGEDGRWPEPPVRVYRDYSAGIPWLLMEMDGLIGPDSSWQKCAERLLAGLDTVEGERYYGMYVRQFTMGLAWLSVGNAK